MALGNLKDLNDYLFAQMDRLDNVDTSNNDELMVEIERANAMCKVSSQIIANANTVLHAVKLKDQVMSEDKAIPLLIGE